MPPIRLDTTYDALVIVLDESEEETFFQKEMTHVFEKQRLLYYRHNIMSADELFQDVLEKVNAHKVMMPQSQRIVFCHFLDINDLDERWMEQYKVRMKHFRDMGMVNDGFQHYYTTFLRYRAVKPLGDKAENIIETLEKFWDMERPFPMKHVEFLLYAGGFSNLEAEEKGAARLLQILSMKDYWRVYHADQFKQGLFILAYDDYYEKRAQDCQVEIKAIEEWMEHPKDADFMQFESRTQQAASAIMRRYREEMRRFQKWSGLYPVSVREYTSHGWGPFKTYARSVRKHAELEQEKIQNRKKFIAGLQDSEEKKAWLDGMESNLNYPDYLVYREGMENGLLSGRIEQKIQECSEKEDLEEQKLFTDLLQTWFRNFIEEQTETLEEKVSDKRDLKILKEYEMGQANQFKNLFDCFSQIETATKFQVPPVIVPVNAGTITLVNGEIGSNWNARGYEVRGVDEDQVAVLPDIAPCEIQCLKLGSYVTVKEQQQSVKHQLRLVLK